MKKYIIGDAEGGIHMLFGQAKFVDLTTFTYKLLVEIVVDKKFNRFEETPSGGKVIELSHVRKEWKEIYNLLVEVSIVELRKEVDNFLAKYSNKKKASNRTYLYTFLKLRLGIPQEIIDIIDAEVSELVDKLSDQTIFQLYFDVASVRAGVYNFIKGNFKDILTNSDRDLIPLAENYLRRHAYDVDTDFSDNNPVPLNAGGYIFNWVKTQARPDLGVFLYNSATKGDTVIGGSDDDQLSGFSNVEITTPDYEEYLPFKESLSAILELSTGLFQVSGKPVYSVLEWLKEEEVKPILKELNANINRYFKFSSGVTIYLYEGYESDKVNHRNRRKNGIRLLNWIKSEYGNITTNNLKEYQDKFVEECRKMIPADNDTNGEVYLNRKQLQDSREVEKGFQKLCIGYAYVIRFKEMLSRWGISILHIPSDLLSVNTIQKYKSFKTYFRDYSEIITDEVVSHKNFVDFFGAPPDLVAPRDANIYSDKIKELVLESDPFVDRETLNRISKYRLVSVDQLKRKETETVQEDKKTFDFSSFIQSIAGIYNRAVEFVLFRKACEKYLAGKIKGHCLNWELDGQALENHLERDIATRAYILGFCLAFFSQESQKQNREVIEKRIGLTIPEGMKFKLDTDFTTYGKFFLAQIKNNPKLNTIISYYEHLFLVFVSQHATAVSSFLGDEKTYKLSLTTPVTEDVSTTFERVLQMGEISERVMKDVLVVYRKISDNPSPLEIASNYKEDYMPDSVSYASWHLSEDENTLLTLLTNLDIRLWLNLVRQERGYRNKSMQNILKMLRIFFGDQFLDNYDSFLKTVSQAHEKVREEFGIEEYLAMEGDTVFRHYRNLLLVEGRRIEEDFMRGDGLFTGDIMDLKFDNYKQGKEYGEGHFLKRRGKGYVYKCDRFGHHFVHAMGYVVYINREGSVHRREVDKNDYWIL